MPRNRVDSPHRWPPCPAVLRSKAVLLAAIFIVFALLYLLSFTGERRSVSVLTFSFTNGTRAKNRLIAGVNEQSAAQLPPQSSSLRSEQREQMNPRLLVNQSFPLRPLPSVRRVAASNPPSARGSRPLILLWTQFFSEPLAPLLALRPECPFECEFTEDKTRLRDAQIRVLHLRNVGEGAEWPPLGNSTVLNAFMSFESPVHSQAPRDIPSPDFFNVSISYRSNADVFYPYNAFVPLDGNETSGEIWSEREVAAKVANKTGSVLISVSNCVAPSGRMEYVRELAKHINVTRVGRCFQRSMSEPEFKQLIDEHHFYLAFENSVCPEYTTEKFFRLKDLIVPIVLSRAVVNTLQIPNDTFVAASDFESPKELAEFLHSLIANKTEYSRYFAWTKKYKRTFLGGDENPMRSLSNAGCQLCRLAVEARAGRLKRRIPSIHRLWSQAACLRDYALGMLDRTPRFVEREAKMDELVRQKARRRFAYGNREFGGAVSV